MILAVTVALALAGAWALGAKPGRLADLRLSGIGFVFAALGAQLLIFTPLAPAMPESVSIWLHLATYCLLVFFVVANIRKPGIWLAGAGFLANLLVIFANGGRMPVSLAAWRASGGDAEALSPTNAYNNVFIADDHTRLAWLGDVFALPAELPLANALSIGDVLLFAGMTTFVYRMCGPEKTGSTGQAFRALRFADFRRLLAGRMVSKLGDWLTMTAVVTWLFESTRSTFAVSAFLIARILSATVGGVAAAPLLAKVSQMRVLSVVELIRGALTVAMLPFAAEGQSSIVIALVCLSYFLGSATNPSASSLVPELLPKDLLHAGNGLHGVSRQIVMMAGAALGAISVSEFGITTALLIDVGTFMAAAMAYLRFSAPGALDAPAAPGERASLRDLLLALRRTPPVLGLTVSFTVVTASIGLLNASLPAFFSRELGQPHGYGYAMAMIAGGLLAGELLTTFVRYQSVARRSVSLAFLVSGIALFVLGNTTVEATAYLMLFLLGASDGCTEIVYDTLFQLHLPRRLRSGVFALASALQNVGMVVGLGLAPVVLAYGTGLLITASAVGCCAGAAIAAATLIRRIAADEDAFGTERGLGAEEAPLPVRF